MNDTHKNTQEYPQMNAYKLSNTIDTLITNPNDGTIVFYIEPLKQISNMLRQQADRIAELEKQIQFLEDKCVNATTPQKKVVSWTNPKTGEVWIPNYTTPQTKPLSDEEIQDLWFRGCSFTTKDLMKFARSIEERHGIK